MGFRKDQNCGFNTVIATLSSLFTRLLSYVIILTSFKTAKIRNKKFPPYSFIFHTFLKNNKGKKLLKCILLRLSKPISRKLSFLSFVWSVWMNFFRRLIAPSTLLHISLTAFKLLKTPWQTKFRADF